MHILNIKSLGYLPRPTWTLGPKDIEMLKYVPVVLFIWPSVDFERGKINMEDDVLIPYETIDSNFWDLAKKLKHEDPAQFHTLVRMHLSFVLDLNTDE